MSLLCSCPPAAAPGDITAVTCFEGLGQIQKFAFQRIYSTGTTKNKFTIASANPNLLASWTALKAATDGTKVVVSPFVEGPVFTPGGPRTFGGGNQTLGGIEKIVGREPTLFEARYDELPQSTVQQLKAYQCEIIGVYLFDEYGRIVGITDSHSSPTEVYPIPVANKSLFIGDKKFGGLEEPDSNMLRWQFLPNWSDLMHVVTPSDFNPLTDL